MPTTQEYIDKLGNNKAVGPDGIGAVLLKAGGCAVAVHINALQLRTFKDESWPVAWKGGRLVDLWKKKGDARVCGNSRGLLISDEMSKCTVGMLKDMCVAPMCKHMPVEQFGGVPGGGTDLANHIIRSLVDLAVQLKWCIFAWFIDLKAAYDGAIRELVFGVPHNWDGTTREYLQSLDLPGSVIDLVCHTLETRGTAMRQAGVDQKVERCINALHSSSWARYGELESCVVSVAGGRQGCKLGGLIFGAKYGLALRDIRDELTTHGIALKLKYDKSIPIWAEDLPTTVTSELFSCNHDYVEAIEATFVDDEALIVMAPTVIQLDKAIEVTIGIVVRIFARYNLIINWEPGKSEAMLRYRHKNSAKALDARRDSTGKVSIALPEACGDKRMCVVQCYKHLGGYVEPNGGMAHEMQHRSKSALNAYTPLSARVFGSRFLNHWCKMSFLESLIMTRLVFNSHIWCTDDKMIKKLNVVHTRCVRRIVGEMRFSRESSDLSDRKVRMKAGAESLDCIILKKRLRYLARLQNANAAPLIALLQVRPNGNTLPWISQIKSDLKFVFASVAGARMSLPHPDNHANRWLEFMTESSHAWKCIVDRISFVDSRVDKLDIGDELAAPAVLQFVCDACGEKFANNKALSLHSQKVHGRRNELRLYLDESGKCPACNGAFQSRLRAFAHLSDRRNTRCKEVIASGMVARISDELAAKLDECDRIARTLARKHGHSHPIAEKSARTADGKRTGRVTR